MKTSYRFLVAARLFLTASRFAQAQRSDGDQKRFDGSFVSAAWPLAATVQAIEIQ